MTTEAIASRPMAQPRKSAARAGSPATDPTDAETRSTLVSIRDLLAKTPEGWRIRRREAWFTLFRG